MPSSHRDISSSRPRLIRNAASTLAVVSVFFPQAVGAQTLLESSRFAAGLIRPLDSRTETTRAVNSAGRADPFVPLNVFLPPEPPPEPSNFRRAPVPPPQAPTARAPVAPRGVVSQPPAPSSPSQSVPPSQPSTVAVGLGSEPVEPVEPEVFIDPAEFAKTVEVSGVITIGGDAYALLSADNTLRDVVQTGEFYETAQVADVSQFGRSVTLQEGGESVTASVPQ